MNIIIISAGASTLPQQPVVQQLRHLSCEEEPASKIRAVHLLLVDIRRMNPACIEAAFAEIAVINRTLGFNLGLLLCHAPTLPLTVSAMRAGLHDLVHTPLDARAVRKLVETAMPGRPLRTKGFSALATLLRTFTRRPAARDLSAELIARREHELSRRAEQLANIEKRLAFDRAALDARDEELRTSTRRLERELTRLQNDADIPAPTSGSTASAFAPADLQALAVRLEQRTRDLDFREKLLHEMESLLTANAKASKPARRQ